MRRFRGWLPLVALPPAALALVPADAPRWAVMWALAVAVYAGCKWLTWRRTPAPTAPAWRHAAYLLLWPGMDARAFLRGPPPDCRPTLAEWLFAVAKLAGGVALVLVAARVVPGDRPLARGWVGMAGIVFVLHFGAFHLLSCAWRAAGIDARTVMDWPVLSRSLGEYWGRRWNTAFRDLAHRFLFRPLAARLGPRAGTAAGFLVSGVVHDLVVSVPAGGGYGGPTLYFVLQGAGLLAQRSAAGLRNRLVTAAVVVGPSTLLFHPPFVRAVVVPFVDLLG